jgi:lactoylglutathione lyase
MVGGDRDRGRLMAPPVAGFFHVGLTVGDVDTSLVFYRDLLGLEVVSDTVRSGTELDGVRTVVGVDPENVRIALLRVPESAGVFVELFAYTGVEQHSATARPWDLAAGHMAFYVEDAEAIHARAGVAGGGARGPVVPVVSGPHTGAKAAYLIDPDGYHVEIFQPPPR